MYRLNKDDPDDKETVTRVGGSHYIMDPRYKYLLYASYGNRIVKDILINSIPAETVVSGLGNVADMVYDKDTQIVYYLDDRKNRIGMYDLKEDVGKELFSDLEDPGKLTIDKGSGSVIWTEGQGPQTVLKRGNMMYGEKTQTIGRYPAVDGSETKILFDPYTRMLYTLSNNRVSSNYTIRSLGLSTNCIRIKLGNNEMILDQYFLFPGERRQPQDSGSPNDNGRVGSCASDIPRNWRLHLHCLPEQQSKFNNSN